MACAMPAASQLPVPQFAGLFQETLSASMRHHTCLQMNISEKDAVAVCRDVVVLPDDEASVQSCASRGGVAC